MSLLPQSLCWIHLGADVDMKVQENQSYRSFPIDCTALTVVTCCDLQGDLPKTGLCFPFWKDFSFSQVNWTNFNKRKWSPTAVSIILHLHLSRVEPFERLTKTSKQSGRLCVDWCFYVVCVWAQCSLGSIVEPQSARAPSLRAGDAPNQELLSGVTDSAQPAVLRPVC